MNTKDIKTRSQRVYALLYGASGGGKTHLCGEANKPYFFDFDIGVKEMKAFYNLDVEFDEYSDEIRNDILVTSGAQKFEGKLNAFDKECPFETLIIDSLASLQDSKLLELCSVNNRRDRHGRLVASELEYGLAISWLKELFRTLPVRYPTKNIIVIAHEQWVEVAISNQVKIRPLVCGKKLPGELPRYFSEMWRLEVLGSGDKAKRVLRTKSGALFDAKSRLQLDLGDKEATWKNIMDAIKGL